MPRTITIEITVDPNTNQVQYRSPLPVPSTVFYLQFVIIDLIMRQREPGDTKNIVVPQLVPPTRPEG
jgi:hypothetical protein